MHVHMWNRNMSRIACLLLNHYKVLSFILYQKIEERESKTMGNKMKKEMPRLYLSTAN